MGALSPVAKLCIYILTWNVGEKSPAHLSLDEALSLHGNSECPYPHRPDIYVVALQEIEVQFCRCCKTDAWVLAVADALGGGYVQVETNQLQGMLIMMFSLPKHVAHMKNIEVLCTRTGFGGWWGNKGAVTIRMTLYRTGVVFVGAHLAAHDEMLEQRIKDYHSIVHNLYYNTYSYETLLNHDLVMWFGDLNFRIVGTDMSWQIVLKIEHGELHELIKRDQLYIVRMADIAFENFIEQLPTFPPTFKYVFNTSAYNLYRRPAWCDRILYRLEPSNNKYHLTMQILSYKSHPSYELSDHKPVSGEFLYTIDTIMSVETQTEEEDFLQVDKVPRGKGGHDKTDETHTCSVESLREDSDTDLMNRISQYVQSFVYRSLYL